MGNRYVDAFRGSGVDADVLARGVDENYFANLPNASSAQDALDVLLNPAAVALLGKSLSESRLSQLKKTVYRQCIAHGVALPSRAVVEARMLGVVVP